MNVFKIEYSKVFRLGKLFFPVSFFAITAWYTPYCSGQTNSYALNIIEKTEPRTEVLAQVFRPLDLKPGKGAVPRKKELPGDIRQNELPAGTRSLGLETQSNPGRTGVSVEKLATIGLDSIGTLDSNKGGFGIDMWNGTSRDRIERLLPKLPVASKSRAMRSLIRRLLLSAAKPPTANTIEKSDSNLINTRVELLISMGDINAATELIKQVPRSSHDRRLFRSEVDSLFMRNDNARVCSLVGNQIGQIETAYWQKAFIFCQSLAGESAKASLGASLLRESGDNDQVFYGLLNQITGIEKFNVESLEDPSPLYFAMARAANVDLPADVVSSNNPAILRTISISPNARPELRLDAAERAESVGAISTEVLRQLYAGVSFSDSALENPLTSVDSSRSPLSRARFYRKVLVEGVPAATIEVLAKVFGLARKTGRYQSVARVYLPILKGLSPNPDFVWFAPEAIRTFLAAGDFESVTPWLSLLKTYATSDKDAERDLNMILPLTKLAGKIDDSEWTPQILKRWWSFMSLQTGETLESKDLIRNKAILLFNLLDGLGEEVQESQWDVLMNGSLQVSTIMPQVSLWVALENASEASKKGETVLLSLLTLGPTGAVQANPLVLRKVLVSLRKVGLEKEARELALETAISLGL